MRSTKKPIQTGLEIDVKPETDQEILNRLAEAEVAKRKPRGPVNVHSNVGQYHAMSSLCADCLLLILSLDHHRLWVYWLYLGVSLK